MKKIFFSLLVLAASMNIMAIDYTAKAKLTLRGVTSGEECYFVIAETNYTPLSALIGEMNMDYRSLALYVSADGKKYQTYAAASLNDIALGLMTSTETNYVITFSDVIGSMTLYDKATATPTPIVGGDSYAFTTDGTAATILDRFVINPSSVQTAFVCQVDGGLSFHGDIAYSGLVIYDENDQEVEPAFDLAVGEDKVVAIAAAGRYYIKNGDQKIFFVVR